MSMVNRLVLLFAAAALCSGQSVRLVPDIAVAEAEYRDAQEAWLHNDPNLERDLFRGNPAEMQARIRRTASLRDTVMVKKEAYLGLLIQRLQGTLGTLQQVSSTATDLPLDSLRKDLEVQQAHILDDQERLEALIRDLPQGDEYFLVRRELDAERNELINLQNNVALRIRSLDSAGKAQEAIKSAASSDTVTQKLAAIIKVWDQERASTIRQRNSWAQLYRTMEQAINPKGTADEARTAGGHLVAAGPAPIKNEELGRDKSAEPSRGGNGVGLAKSASLAGAWMYRSDPGAWTGYGEPEMVTLEIVEDGKSLRGSYSARLPVRSGVHEIRLSLEGSRQTATSAHLRWKSQAPPAEGEMEIQLGSDGRLFVERTRSDDGYVPRGMEVLVRR